MIKLLRNLFESRKVKTGVLSALSLLGLLSSVPANAALSVDKLYLVGEPNGWNIDASSFILKPTESGIYEGTYYIGANQFQFRFYTGLGNWDNGSLGAGPNDSGYSITLTNDSYTGSYVSGKGSWLISGWQGGFVQMTVNSNSSQVSFSKVNGVPSDLNLYVIGDNVDGQSWALGTNKMTYNSSDQTYVWEGNVLGCNGFKINDGSWTGLYNLGSNGNPITLNTPYSFGNGDNITFSNQSQVVKNPKVVLDLSKRTVTVSGTLMNMPSAEELMGDEIYVIGQLEDWDLTNCNTTLAKSSDKVYKGTVEVPFSSQQNSFRFYVDNTWGWNNFSYGAGAADENSVTIKDDATNYNGDLVEGQGNWILEAWNGGSIDMTVDFNQMKVSFVLNEDPLPQDVVFYLKGANVNGENTWGSNQEKLTYDEESGNYIWKGSSLGTGFKLTDSEAWNGRYNIGSKNDALLTVGQPFEFYNDGGSGNINFVNNRNLVENPVLTLDLDKGTLTLTGTEVAYQPKAVAIYYKTEDGNEAKFNLTSSESAPLVFTGTMTKVTANDQFKVVLDGSYWYSWGNIKVYENFGVTEYLSDSVEDYTTITTANGTDIMVTLDWNKQTVSFEGANLPTRNIEEMWLVGPFQGWSLDNKQYLLKQTGDNNGIYSGTFTLPKTAEFEGETKNGGQFKIAYGTESDWSETFGNVSGAQFPVYTSEVETNFKDGGENWVIYNWQGGEITVTLNLEDAIVNIAAPKQPAFSAPKNVSLRGFGDWDKGYDMEDLGNGSYSISITVAAATNQNKAEFKILADDVWFGPNAGESNLVLKLNDPVDYDMVVGYSDNWSLGNWTGGEIVFTANFSEEGNTLTLNQTSGIEALQGADNSDDVIFNLQGLRVNRNNMTPGLYIINGKKVMVK